jgi:hypothetical protein
MAKKFVLKEGTISIGGVQLQIKDGQVNPEDQSPEGMDLLQKIANAINGSDDVQINLPGGGAQGGIPGGMPPEGAMGTGGPLEPGGPPMDDMGGDMGGGPPPKIGGIGGGPEDDMGGPPPGISDDEGGGPPPEIGDSEDEGEGEDEGEEGKEEGDGEDEGEEEGEDEGGEDEGEGEEDEGDDEEDDDNGPPKKGPPEKGKNPFADDINRIAACITEDINVNNGKLLAEDVKKK